MPAFHFKLGRLSRVRDLQEQSARNLWAAAETIAQNHIEVVEHYASEIANARSELGLAQAEEAIEVGEILRFQHAIERLVERMASAHELAKTSRYQADQLEESWRTAKSDSRALERLEERQRDEHEFEERKLESLKMDEIAIERNFASRRGERLQSEELTR